MTLRKTFGARTASKKKTPAIKNWLVWWKNIRFCGIIVQLYAVYEFADHHFVFFERAVLLQYKPTWFVLD